MSNVEVVVITVSTMLVLFAIFLAVLLKHKHKPIGFDGFLDVSATDASQIYQLDIATDPSKLKDQKHVSFKVRKIRPDDTS